MKNIEKLGIVMLAKQAASVPPPQAEEEASPNYAQSAGYGALGGAGIGGLIHLLGALFRGDNPLSLNMLTSMLTGGGIGGALGAGGAHYGGLGNLLQKGGEGLGKYLDSFNSSMKPPSGQMYGPNVDSSGQNKWERAGLETPGSDKSASVRFLKQLQAGNPQAMLAGNKGALTAGVRGIGNPGEMSSILKNVSGGGGETSSNLAFLRKLLGTSDDAAANASTRSENAALRAGKRHQPNVDKSKEHMQAHQKGQAQKLDAEAKQLKDQKRELTEGSARADAKGALKERYNDLPNTNVVESVRHRLRSFIKALQGEGSPAVPTKQLPR